jgi:hypothetical protein
MLLGYLYTLKKLEERLKNNIEGQRDGKKIWETQI